jgi:hypothetical protein
MPVAERHPIMRRPPLRRLPLLDFEVINREALHRLPEVLARLLPGGRAIGPEWHAGSLRGEPGDSLRVRIRGERAGRWADFATGEKGGDGSSHVEPGSRTGAPLARAGTCCSPDCW